MDIFFQEFLQIILIFLFVGKKRRLTIIECGCDINMMIDLAKVADLVSQMQAVWVFDQDLQQHSRFFISCWREERFMVIKGMVSIIRDI